MSEDNIIRVGYKPSDLVGRGTEYLVVNGVIVAKLYDGNFIHSALVGNTEDTITAAA